MTAKPTPLKPVAYGWQDLQKITGLGREAVKAGIRCGQLPGYVVGKKYVVPVDAFEAFRTGKWVPQPRPYFAVAPKPIHIKKAS